MRKRNKPLVLHRDLWGERKREELLESLDSADFDALYTEAAPTAENRFSFRPGEVTSAYASWPRLPDLAGRDAIPGLLEMRREALLDRDENALAQRMRRYLDPATTVEMLRQEGCGPVFDMARFDAAKARELFLRTEHFDDARIRRYQQRPFDDTWCYYTTLRPIWNEPRPDLGSLVNESNPCLVSRAYRERPHEGPHILVTRALPDYHLLRPNVAAVPFFDSGSRANLSPAARSWLAALGLPDPDSDRDTAVLPWLHALAIGYSPAWLAENDHGIRQDWPRIPLPGSADLLRASAALGRRVADLLDPDTPVPGVTEGTIDPALRALAVPTKQGGSSMSEADRALTAGWGHAGKGGAVMPGRGRAVPRAYAAEEADTAAHAALLGARTLDVFLNDAAYWRNIPEHVWSFAIGGYQVLKKWLSYREKPLLGRALTPAEVRYVRDTARRLAALRLLGPDLDTNYHACAEAHRPL